MDKQHGELLLPSYLSHGFSQDYAKDMDRCRYDAEKSAKCSQLGDLPVQGL